MSYRHVDVLDIAIWYSNLTVLEEPQLPQIIYNDKVSSICLSLFADNSPHQNSY